MALRLHPAINSLRRAPGFSALVVVTLALAIGATTGARVIESMLFGTDPRDPLTLGAATLLLPRS